MLHPRIQRCKSFLVSNERVGAFFPCNSPEHLAQITSLRPLTVQEVMNDAHVYFGVPEAVIIFIVQPGERNIFDQKMLELALWEQYRLKVIRLSLEEVSREWWMGNGTDNIHTSHMLFCCFVFCVRCMPDARFRD